MWGEGVMVGGLGRGCLWLVDVEWLRVVFSRYNAVQCEARGMFRMHMWQGAKDVFGMGKEVYVCRHECVVRCRLFALYAHVVWWVC